MPLRSALLATALSAAAVLPEGAPVETRVPDVAAELREFAPSPPAWSDDVVDAVLGGGTIAQEERRSGWLAPAENWELVDYVDRAYNYTTHGWLAHRGIYAEHYGYNEFQETIHMTTGGALALLGERGLARGPMGELVIETLPGLDRAFIADPIEPRWSAILAYDQATSPLLGDAISQDNIGGAQEGMGPNAIGRFGNAAERGFALWRARRGEPELPPIRSELRARFGQELASLRPYAPPERFDERRADAAARALCDDPVLADFQLFHTAASLASWARLYTNLRQVAARAGRAFDVHGNLGGGPMGPDAYPFALAPLVDTVWFETTGLAQYDLSRHAWWDAWGALRLELAEAVASGRNVMFLAQPEKQTPDFVAQEMAEISAGGGVPLINPDLLARDAPDALPAFTALMQLRDRHRAVFSPRGRARVADVAILYSVASVLFDQCVPEASSADSPVLNDFSAAARALEELHEPYDVAVLQHPELVAARPPAVELSRYRVVIAPSLERLSDADLARLAQYLRGGGTLAVLGRLATRDERNRPRAAAALAQLRAAGRVQPLLGGRSFPASRVTPSPATLAQGVRLKQELRALLPVPRVGGELRPTTWVKLWRHPGGFVTAHFVSYAIDFASGAAPALPGVAIDLRLPKDVRAESARWLAPGEAERELPLRVEGGVAHVTLPALRVYGVLVVGPRGAEARASALARGDRRLARARMAGAGVADLEPRLRAVAALRARDPQRFDAASGELLRALSAEREAAYIETVQSFAAFDSPVAAFTFGQNADVRPFTAVRPDSDYSPTLGFGWLPPDDDSIPSPEEKDYTTAAGIDPDALRAVSLYSVYWPYAEAQLPRALSAALVSGRSRVFKLDLPDGDYRVSVVGAMGAFNQLNLLVSGMVFANGAPALLDVPLDKGSLARRSFTTRVEGGSLELRFGGPTGFGVAALQVDRASALEPDPLEAGAVRRWRVSERHPNPDWAPLRDVAVPESAAPREVRAAERGIPLVDLGTLAQASIGDVVVARAELDRPGAGEVTLRVGSSSAARVYLNGAQVLELANVKGVERDEGVARVQLRPGRNELEVVLERFWERRWLFFASVDGVK